MKCKSTRCLSPTACQGFGHCRDANRPFKVTRFIVEPVLVTQLTGRQSEFRTIEISAKSQRAADKIADDHPEWFNDNNAVIARQAV